MATHVEGYQAQGDEASNPRLAPHRFVVGPDYFRTAGIRRVLGREFTLRDNEKAPKVAIVNEQFARYFFGPENPIGRHMGWGKLDHEIIGVVKDAKYYEIREEPLRVWYVPFAQAVDRSSSRASVLVRTAGNPERVIVAVRRELQAIDANVPVTMVKTVETLIGERLSTERLLTHLLSGFALLSAILVAIGLYGVMACSVARRTREIGVRMALGADAVRVFRMVIRESFSVVALGLLLGVPAALAVCRVTASILYGVSPDDATSLTAAALLMCAVALTAACLPARRATKVDPIVALRAE